MGIIFLSNSGASISHDLLNALDDWSLIRSLFRSRFHPLPGRLRGIRTGWAGAQRTWTTWLCPPALSIQGKHSSTEKSRKQHLQSSVNKLFSVDLRRWKSCWALFFSFCWFFKTCWDFSLSDFFCLTCDSSLSVVVVVLATPLRAMIMETTAGDLLHLGCTSFPFITVLLRSLCALPMERCMCCTVLDRQHLVYIPVFSAWT